MKRLILLIALLPFSALAQDVKVIKNAAGTIYTQTTSMVRDTLQRANKKIVYVKDYGDNFAGVKRAITAAGDGGVVVFTPGKVYLQTSELAPKRYQKWIGNKATLKRQPETIVTLTTAAPAADSSFVVSSVPTSWAVGDHVFLYADTSGATNIVDYRIIKSIVGTTISVYGSLGARANGSAVNYAIGTKVKKVWDQVSNYPPNLQVQNVGYVDSAMYSFTLDGLIFDGNKSLTGDNVSWYVNRAIFAMGRNIVIENCEFYDIPNDCIEGHGFVVNNNIAKRLNNSFIHLSAYIKNFVSGVPLIQSFPSIITNNVTDSTNIFRSESPINGSQHSRGVIDFSASGGHITVTGNRFSNGNDAVFGSLFNSGLQYFTGTSDMVISGNYAKNILNGIFYSISNDTANVYKGGTISVTGNIFDNCGSTIWPPEGGAVNYDSAFDSMLVSSNLLIRGTEWYVPLRFKDTDKIINQTFQVQNGGFNIKEAIIDSLLKVTNLSAGTAGMDSLIVHDNATNTIKRVSPTYYGVAGSGVTSITGTSNQVTASASTGAVTLSLPQSIATSSTPTFASLYTGGDVGFGTSTPYTLANYRFATINGPVSGGGFVMQKNGVHKGTVYSANDDVYIDAAGGVVIQVGGNIGGGISAIQLSAAGVVKIPQLTGSITDMVTITNDGTIGRTAIPSGGGGGSVNTIGVSSSNGFAGSSTGGANPALTLTTTVTADVLKANGTAISAAPTTGSGNVVLATSPSLVTPNLGTPASGVMTNVTGTAVGLTAGNIVSQANSATITASTSESANTIVQRDANADIFARTVIVNPAYGDFAPNKLVGTSVSGQIREMSLAQAQSYLGLGSNAYTSTTYAPLASPTFTGTPTAPTATAGTNTTQIATTAFVQAATSTGYNIYTRTTTSTQLSLSDFGFQNTIIVRGDATSNAVEIVLPQASTWTGKIIYVKKIDNVNSVTVKGWNGTELIDGANLRVMSTQYSTVALFSNGTTIDIL